MRVADTMRRAEAEPAPAVPVRTDTARPAPVRKEMTR
jgi:hypothetical protein